MAGRKSYTRDKSGARRKAKQAGDTYYFTGLPCIAGHVAKRLTSTGQCVVCVKASKPERDRAYRKAHKDKIRQMQRAWNAANPERRAATLQRYWQKAEAKATNRLASARIRARNPKRIMEWKRANPEAAKALWNKRRAQKSGSNGTHTRAQLKALFALQKSKCAMCKCLLQRNYHVDHIMPLSKGGSNHIRNIQLLCAPCNLSKGAKHPVDWARERGLLL